MISKFRLWDNERGKYFEPTYRAYAGDLEYITLGMNGRLQMHTFNGNKDESCFKGRFTKEFSIGMKDKNGKEIYVGDILKDSNGETGSVMYSEVGIHVLSDLGMIYLLDCRLEIVGNIHEEAQKWNV